MIEYCSGTVNANKGLNNKVDKPKRLDKSRINS